MMGVLLLSRWWCLFVLLLAASTHGWVSLNRPTRRVTLLCQQQQPTQSAVEVLEASSSSSCEHDEAQENVLASPVVEATPLQSILLLNLVAVIWGSQHAVIKSVVMDDASVAAFTFLRFCLAAAVAAPYTPSLSSSSSTAWRWGLEMGAWMFLGYACQAVGLETTTAQKSGFLLYLNVKFVPFFARLLLGRQITVATWTSAVVAFTGTALLAYDPGTGFDLDVGDAWSIAAAAASAMFILRLEKASVMVQDASELNAACLWVVTFLSGIWMVEKQGEFTLDCTQILSTHWGELLYLSVITTALANWMQSKAQKDVSAERASVIYAMDPVYGAFFATWLLGEQLNGVTGWTGATLITVAAATNAFLDFSSSSSPVKEGGSGPSNSETW